MKFIACGSLNLYMIHTHRHAHMNRALFFEQNVTTNLFPFFCLLFLFLFAWARTHINTHTHSIQTSFLLLLSLFDFFSFSKNICWFWSEKMFVNWTSLSFYDLCYARVAIMSLLNHTGGIIMSRFLYKSLIPAGIAFCFLLEDIELSTLCRTLGWSTCNE